MTDQDKSQSDIELARQLAEHHSDIILKDLGFSVRYDGGCKAACQIHGGDNPTAFSWDNRRKIWSCFTHGCQKTHGNNIIGLIRAVKNVTLEGATRYILKTLSLDLSKINWISIDEASKERLNKLAKFEEEMESLIFDENTVSDKSYIVPYYLKRGFTQTVLTEFQAFTCKNPNKSLYQRACLPIRNYDGDIVGFTGRQIIEDPKWPKWKYGPLGIRIRNHIYGLYKSKDFIKKTGTVVLVEGPLDFLKLWQYGIKNTGAVFGTTIANRQIKLLRKAGAKRILLAFDPDDAGIKASLKEFEKLRLFFEVTNVTEKLTNDPGEMSPEDLKRILC